MVYVLVSLYFYGVIFGAGISFGAMVQNYSRLDKIDLAFGVLAWSVFWPITLVTLAWFWLRSFLKRCMRTLLRLRWGSL
jgi:uncharacterized membrane protein